MPGRRAGAIKSKLPGSSSSKSGQRSSRSRPSRAWRGQRDVAFVRWVEATESVSDLWRLVEPVPVPVEEDR